MQSFSSWLNSLEGNNDSLNLTSTAVSVPDSIKKAAKQKIEELKSEKNYIEPDRGNLSDEKIDWRNGQPDYTVANLAYFFGKTQNHQNGSLELIVENLVKTWEMEATHKKDYFQWGTVQHDVYSVQANGNTNFPGQKGQQIGNYNILLDGCPADLYDNKKEDFESSHSKFQSAFPTGFPWEVLQVYSGPPRVTFLWRHWAEFNGEYKGNKGNGEIVELFGFGVVDVNSDLKILKIEIYYDPKEFLEVLEGKKSVENMQHPFKQQKISEKGGCPFAAKTDTKH